MRIYSARAACIAALTAAIALGLSGAPAAADPRSSGPPLLSVTGSGSVTYAPDIARLSLGVRAESASAAAAAKSVNVRAQAVISGLRKLGIADSDITTSNYTIEYQEPQDGGSPLPAQVQSQSMSVAPRPAPSRGVYVATEEIDVRTSVAKAGEVLDAAVAAGSNQTYGISFDTSQRVTLYREALARAVADARAQAEILAKAAGMSIAGIQSISAGGTSPQPLRGVAMMAAASNAPVMGGTGSVDANVDIVYRLR